MTTKPATKKIAARSKKLAAKPVKSAQKIAKASPIRKVAKKTVSEDPPKFP
jgi:hypothetical protein